MKTSSPSLTAWILALFSVTMLLALGAGVATTSNWFARFFAHRKLEDSLAQLNAPRTEVGIQLLTKVNDSPVVQGLNTLREISVPTDNSARNGVAMALLIAQRAIIQNEWHTAINQISVARESLRLTSSSPLKDQDLALLEELLERAEVTQNDLSRIRRGREQKVAEFATLRDRYSLITNDLADLLGLRHPDAITSDSNLVFYTSGVMEGLPVLQGLTDGIQSLDELKTALAIAGGQVKIQGPGAAATFAAALQEAKQRSLELQRDQTDQVSEVEALEDQIVTLKDELERSTKRAILSINAHIVRVAT